MSSPFGVILQQQASTFCLLKYPPERRRIRMAGEPLEGSTKQVVVGVVAFSVPQ